MMKDHVRPLTALKHLVSIRIFSTRMCGLDPDEPEDPQLKAWNVKHPPISKKRKQVARENLIEKALEDVT